MTDRKNGAMRLLYLVLTFAIIALGMFHIAATPHFFAHLTPGALWFASGGVAIILTGALNLLRRAYGEMAPGVRLVCVIANVLMTGFALLVGYASQASGAQFIVVLGLLGGVTVLSLLPAAQKHFETPRY